MLNGCDAKVTTPNKLPETLLQAVESISIVFNSQSIYSVIVEYMNRFNVGMIMVMIDSFNLVELFSPLPYFETEINYKRV